MQRATLILAASLTLAIGLGSCDHRERVRAYGAPPEARVYAATVPQAAAVPAPAPAPGQLDDGQLDQLLAPVALYPDPLVAQLLPAATYPDDVADAVKWLKDHPEADDGDIDRQPWEPSVKALAHYPEVLQMLNDHPDWTQALGAAFLNQQEGVMASIQRLRQKAVAVKTLQDTPEQQVVVEQGVIEILPADPEVIYVPVYDPVVVYEYCPVGPPIMFWHRHHVGVWLGYSCDWHSRVVVIGDGWHHGLRYDGRRWRHEDVVGRDGRDSRTGTRDGRDVNRNPRDGRDTRAVGGRDARTVAIWSHNNAKPRPTLPPALISNGGPDRRTGRTSDRTGTLGTTSGSQYKPFSLPVREGGTSLTKSAVSAHSGPGTSSQTRVVTPIPRPPASSGRDTRNTGSDTRRDTGREDTGKIGVRSNSQPLPSTIRRMPSDIPAAPALFSQQAPARRDRTVTPMYVPPATPSHVRPVRPDIRLAAEPAPRQISVPTPRAEAAPREFTIPAPKGEPTRTFMSTPQVRSSGSSDTVRERSVDVPRAAERARSVRSAGADDAPANSSVLRSSRSVSSPTRAGDSDAPRSRGGNSSADNDDQGNSRDRSGRR